MADRGDTHYSVPLLNKWFLISSGLMLASFLWMIWNDFARPWKGYQREFRRIETAIVRAESERLEREGAHQTEADLAQRVEEAQRRLAAREQELAAKQEELRLARGARWRVIEEAKKRKSEYNWERYRIEEERLRLGQPDYGAEPLARVERAMADAAGRQEQEERSTAEAEKVVADLTAEVSAAQAALTAGTRELDRVRKRLAQLDRGAMDAPHAVADVIRDDIPGFDFIKPNLKVNKVVLDNLTFELNFTKKKRIDMCHTCHLGADRAGFEAEAQPFGTHPRLDLFLTAKSPHPLKDVGCTICHRGAGEALEFVRADHRPSDQAEAERWHAEHGWHKQHHWDYPMLSSDFTEASCVQCHKTSMELIAADAPRVSEGYRLVERYGCYACHKIDWFPTKRRPGPSLRNLQAKLTPEFVSAWVTEPKAFRPSTWMPQFFHLENFAQGASVVKSRYGQGRDIEGREWDDASVAAIVAFLRSRAPLAPLPPAPAAGDADRGRELMRVSGCFACHNVAPYGDEESATKDLAAEPSPTNQHGPNLRGVAIKVTRDWLYAWIKDPQAYWPDTRMPNLRLSDDDAADITAYVMEDPDGIFTDVPEGWQPKSSDMPAEQMHEVLAEQARWQFARDGRAAIEDRLAGRDPARRWDDLETLKVAVGEKLTLQFGCFSCHEVNGLLDTMPIGTELSNWGSKTVDKLDFGFGVTLYGLDPQYREGWLMKKLHEPRSFDKDKVKNPTEKLRMPWFRFTEDQVQSIATFVVGLVDDEVQRAKMVCSPDEAAREAGMRAVRQKNCAACHQIDPGRVTFEDEQGRARTVAAELLPFDEEKLPPPHALDLVQSAAKELEVDEVVLRVLAPEPEVGLGVGDKLFVPADRLRAFEPPHGGDFVRAIADYYYYGIELVNPEAAGEDDRFLYVQRDPEGDWGVEDVDGVVRDHSEEPYDKVRWTFAPPVLWDEGGKVQRDWFFGFLNDVVPLRPQLRVRMPSFHFAPGEAESIASYFAYESARRWPAEYARRMRLALKRSAAEVAAASGLSESAVLGIENGSAADVAASFAKLRAFGDAQGFTFRPPVDPAYEVNELRTEAYLARRAAEEPGHLKTGDAIADEAVNCFQCHFQFGAKPPADPIAWAPDFARVHERLREDWVRDWLANPGTVYPGTAMPANFAADVPQYQDRYPGSTNAQQIRVVLELLFNFDRFYLDSLKN